MLIISCALRDLLRIDVKRLNRVRNTLLNQNIVLLLHALTCNEEKEWRWRFCKFLSAMRIELNFRWSFEWCSSWCFRNNMWLLIAAQRSQVSYDLRLLIVTRTNRTVCWSQSKDANRDNYSSDSNVRLLLSEDWFTYMHQLIKIRIASHIACYSNESLLHQEQNSWSTMYSTISIETFNDYRISLIHDLFVILTVFELESVKFFWLHHSTHISKSVH